jgi:hypothetical protein
MKAWNCHCMIAALPLDQLAAAAVQAVPTLRPAGWRGYEILPEAARKAIQPTCSGLAVRHHRHQRIVRPAYCSARPGVDPRNQSMRPTVPCRSVCLPSYVWLCPQPFSCCQPTGSMLRPDIFAYCVQPTVIEVVLDGLHRSLLLLLAQVLP